MPTSASGSPSVQSSQSTTAATSPERREDHVVEPVVAVDDRRRPLLGDPRGEALVDLVDHRQLARLRLLPLALPAVQLARDVVLLACRGRQARPRRDRPRGCRPACRRRARRSRGARPRRRLLGLRPRAQDRALDEVHHVERRAVHGLVLAEADDRRHRDRRVLERGDDLVLAAHVVRRAEPLAERRPAQRPAPPGGVARPVGQVRAPAGDPLELERQLDPGHVACEPAPRRRRGRCPRAASVGSLARS